MNTKEYKNTLVKNLMVFYRLDTNEAIDAVDSSTVAYMLNLSEKAAKWQMHQSLDSTLKEIYQEYTGIPV